MKNKNVLLIMDPQYDFCHPEGTLFVPGADDDMKRLSYWIIDNEDDLDHIIVTGDWHHVNNIGHPSFWKDAYGNFPEPFTTITAKDIRKKLWTPRFYQKEAVAYVEALEMEGEFQHIIWPYHCIVGSQGAAIDNNIITALKEWSKSGKYYEFITKGTYSVSEHFGIFRANIPSINRPETQWNQTLVNTLEKFETIFLAGEAKSHCVANSVKQISEGAPHILNKLVLLEDAMSEIPGLGYLGNRIYANARQKGVQFKKTTEVNL